jgi:hypothetical protein
MGKENDLVWPLAADHMDRTTAKSGFSEVAFAV